MKTKQTLTILLMLLLSFGTWSCEKDEKEKNWTSLPAETQEGKNTIGCLVDGKVWATNYWGNIGNFIVAQRSMSAVYHKNLKNKKSIIKPISIGIGACKKDKTCISILILAENIETDINLKSEFVISRRASRYGYHKGKGFVHLTKFDTINRIISGKFSFEAIHEEDKTDTLKVTDGRFDMELIIDKN